jgi:CheY-like chemotaxis protein
LARIFVVDDEPNIVELVTFLLEKDGHTIFGMFDGQECINRAQAEKPDLILLDIMMPGLDGYTVFTRLMENEETRHIPIIVLTAKGQMRETFQMAGRLADYVDKPFDPDALRQRVDKALSAPR